MDTHTPIAYLALAGLFAIVSLSMHATTAATTNTVTANVNVFCPFAVTLNALPVYARVGNYIFNYSIESLASCSISSLGGDFTLTYTSNGAVLLTDPITIGTVTQTNTLYYTSPVNTLALPSGNYVAEVAFSNSFESNSSSKNIELLDPVNITVENFSTSSSVTQDGPITFDVGLKNVGEFASGTIGINMLIVGPQVYRISQSAGALSPSQGEVVAITLTTVTSTVGSYNALANATYLSNSVVEVSNNMTTTFSVSSPAAPSGGGGPPVKKPANVITPVSGVSFTSMPLYTSLSQGSTSTGVFGFLNTGNQAEFVNVSVSNSLLGYVSFSSNTVYLQPGASSQISVTFAAQSLPVGTYYVPVNVTAAIANATIRRGLFQNGTSRQTEYLTYRVAQSNLSQSNLLSKQITVTKNSTTVNLFIMMPQNQAAQNATLITDLPPGLAENLSDISTYGLPANITEVNSHPRITWQLEYLAPGQTAYVSYTIKNPLDYNILPHVQSTFYSPTTIPTSAILKVIDIGAPTFYLNATNKITVQVLYTGTTTDQMTIALTPPATTVVRNPVQIFNVTPNQLVTAQFNVPVGDIQGTLLFQLYIATSTANITYSVPVIVTQKQAPVSSTIPLPQQINIPISVSPDEIKVIGEAAAVAIVIIAIYYFARKGVERPKYRRERSEELIRIREQIKRSDKLE